LIAGETGLHRKTLPQFVPAQEPISKPWDCRWWLLSWLAGRLNHRRSSPRQSSTYRTASEKPPRPVSTWVQSPKQIQARPRRFVGSLWNPTIIRSSQRLSSRFCRLMCSLVNWVCAGNPVRLANQEAKTP